MMKWLEFELILCQSLENFRWKILKAEEEEEGQEMLSGCFSENCVEQCNDLFSYLLMQRRVREGKCCVCPMVKCV